MEIKRSELEQAVRETAEEQEAGENIKHVRMIAEALAKTLGATIIDDTKLPEPVKLVTPLRVYEPGSIYTHDSAEVWIVDSSDFAADRGCVLARMEAGVPYATRKQIANALVAAYNAAGQTEKSVAEQPVKHRLTVGPCWLSNCHIAVADGVPVTAGSHGDTPIIALGNWLRRHAAELNVEIVES